MEGSDRAALLPSAEAVQAVLKKPVTALPPFPLVATRLLRVTRDESASADDVAAVVEQDPAIAAKILTIVNSAAYGSLRKLSSIRHAVVLLGISEIRSIAMGLALFDGIVSRAGKKNFDALYFWKHCLAMAGLSKALAEAVGMADPAEAYVAGLLHDIGKVILDGFGKVSYSEFVDGLAAHDGQVVDREREIIGMGHDEVGAYYCDRWEMPGSLVLALLFHHRRFGHLELSAEAGRLVAVVALADFICWSQGFGSLNVVRHPILHPDVEQFIAVDKLNLSALMMRMDREINNTAQYYGFTLPSSEAFRENLLRANIELGQVNTRYAVHLAGEISALSRINQSITRPHRSLDPEEIIAGTLEAIHLDFGFDRLFVLQTNPKDRSLSVTGVFSGRQESPASLMELAIHPDEPDGPEEKNGFIQCMRTQMPVLITGRTGVERRFLSRIGSRHLGIVPIAANNRVTGLIGVDNTPSGRTIRIEALPAVAIIANEMGLALENARIFEEISDRAAKDGLTGVYNRTTIEGILESVFARSQAGEDRLSIAMIDVDFFKRFNDRYGHLAGDSILKLIAGTLTKFSRPGELVGRYGGEEFLSILKDTDVAGAVRYGERIRRKVEDLGKLLVNRFPEHELTVSVGVAESLPEISVKEQLIDMADKAMYAAKGKGRNRVMKAWRKSGGETGVGPGTG